MEVECEREACSGCVLEGYCCTCASSSAHSERPQGDNQCVPALFRGTLHICALWHAASQQRCVNSNQTKTTMAAHNTDVFVCVPQESQGGANLPRRLSAEGRRLTRTHTHTYNSHTTSPPAHGHNASASALIEGHQVWGSQTHYLSNQVGQNQ